MKNMRSSWNLYYAFVVIVLFYEFDLCTGQTSDCVTPNSNLGLCIEIRKCPELFDMLLTSNQDQRTVDILRASQCGFEGRYPKVCCSLSTVSSSTTTTTTTARTTTDPDVIQRTTKTASQRAGPEEDYSVCGKVSITADRIVDGKPAELGAWPWMAALGYRTPSRPGPDFRCGGALISDRHVVTAAHCILNIGSFTLSVVRLGELDLDESVKDGASPVDIPVAKVTPHSKYVASPVENDIAIITLQRPIQFTKLIRPICLPKTPTLRAETFAKRMPFIIGWGATGWRSISSTHLLQAQVPTVDMEKCKQSYAQKREAVIDERVICAGDGRKDSCQGDSGGPLIQPNGTTNYLIGVVSFGIRCAEANFPGVYTRITYFLDWIDANTK